MLTLDLEYLWHNFGRKAGRGTGRTWDMLIEAAHQTGSCTLVSVKGHDSSHAMTLAETFMQLAQIIGYTVSRPKTHVVRLYNPEDGQPTVFDFQGRESFVKRHGSNEEVFADHYA